MKNVPQGVINAFQKAYVSESTNMVLFKKANEGSDGVIYRFGGNKPNQLLKIMFLYNENTHLAKRLGSLRVEARLKFLHYLNKQNAPAIQLVPSLSGSLYETLEEQSGFWLAYSMEKALGKTISPMTRDPEIIRHWGQAVGKVHLLAKNYPSWKGAFDPQTNKTYLTWQNEWQSFYDLCREEDIRVQWGRIKEDLDSFPIDRKSFGFIHNDPHLWNVKVDGKKVILLDFDVANHHWFANDIAIACQHVLMMQSGGLNRPVHHLERLVDFLKLFMNGYSQENALDRDWLKRLDTFIAYRRILLYIVMEGWRQSDPALQKFWKGMILNQPDIFDEFLIDALN